MNGFKIYQMLEIDCLLKLKPEEILREILIKMKKKNILHSEITTNLPPNQTKITNAPFL